jgi:hypothetical protein
MTVAAAALLVGCEGQLRPESGPAEIVVQNEQPVQALVVVGDGLGYYRAFSVPARSWARLPGTWATVYQVDESCVAISSSNFQPGGLALVRIEADGSLHVIDDRSFMPTLGPLSSATPLSLCPNGPTFVPVGSLPPKPGMSE